VVDACQVHNEGMPVCIVLMGDQSISVLRDRGCSIVVADDEQMTGGTETCAVIDGTVRSY